MIDAFWKMEKRKIIDAIFAVANDEEINEGLRRSGRHERIDV